MGRADRSSREPGCVRGRTLGLAAALIALLLPAGAGAAEIVTWEAPGVSESRFVDPAAAPEGSYNEPPGVAERPNALRADVYLPDGYDPDHRRGYPVLYLMHGQGDAYDSWPNPANGDLMETARGFEGIIVMPEGDRGFYADWWNGGVRGEPAWERYHLDQLVPYVERRLPIRAGRRWHAIAGLSMGGEGAMYYASQRPGYFGSAAAFSGPLSIQRPTYQQAFDFATGQSKEAIFGDPEAQEFYWRGHNPRELVGNLAHTRLYVAAGDGVPDPSRPEELQNTFGQAAEAELGQQAAEFVAAAGELEIEVTYDPHQGIHDWPYWRADLANAIEWGLFEPPPSLDRSWTFDTVARKGRAWRVGFRFAEPPAEVIRFERDGPQLSGQGSGEVVLRRRGFCPVAAELPFEIGFAELRAERLRNGC